MRWGIVTNEVTALALIVTLSGCGGTRDSAENVMAEISAHWEKKSDGSQVAFVTMNDGQTSAAVRCWPDGEPGFLCVKAAKYNNYVAMTTISRGREHELPTIILPPSNYGGYWCRYSSLSGLEEGIAELDSNEVGKSARWSGKYVKTYMRDNNVSGLGHFGCLDVLDAIRRGSLETIGTTSVTRRMIG